MSTTAIETKEIPLHQCKRPAYVLGLRTVNGQKMAIVDPRIESGEVTPSHNDVALPPGVDEVTDAQIHGMKTEDIAKQRSKDVKEVVTPPKGAKVVEGGAPKEVPVETPPSAKK